MKIINNQYIIITAGIILAAIAMLGFIMECIVEDTDHDEVFYSFIGWLCGGLCALGLCMAGVEYNKSKTPTTMDVYQDKTTLEYTVVDGTIKDSTVVWKYIGE